MMHQLAKRNKRTFLALNVFVWTILAAAYLSSNGSMRRIENEEQIDFRLIVITFNRPASLLKALKSIDELELDGDKAILEIWIDRSKSGLVNNKTVEVAQSFNWTRGPTGVHIQESHAGIRGQWIDSWKPTNDNELAIFVEDDVSLSRYAYRWLKAIHAFYGKREDFAGTSLTSDQLSSLHVSPMVPVKASKNETAFMYSCVGSWGFSPKQTVWKRFQAWYHTHVNDTHFHPYVDGIRPTLWYKAYEKAGKADSVWTQWFVYFTEMEKLFTVYNNLPTYVGDRNSCLSINRREVGLHTSRKGREDFCKLLNRWDERFVHFSENITRFNWAGKNADDKDANKRLNPQPIRSTSKEQKKVTLPGKKVVDIESNKTSISKLIKLKTKEVTKLDLPSKKTKSLKAGS